MLINKIKNVIEQGYKNVTIEAEDFNVYKFNQSLFYVHIMADTEDEEGELIDTQVYFNKTERDVNFEAAENFIEDVQ